MIPLKWQLTRNNRLLHSNRFDEELPLKSFRRRIAASLDSYYSMPLRPWFCVNAGRYFLGRKEAKGSIIVWNSAWKWIYWRNAIVTRGAGVRLRRGAILLSRRKFLSSERLVLIFWSRW